MHIYGFGSICRGEIDFGSDIDILAIVERFDERFDPNLYSVYSYQRIKDIWKEGNPFAWHLSMQAKMLFSDTGSNFLLELGLPEKYNNSKLDCKKFHRIFLDAKESFFKSNTSQVFDLSSMFLAIRNIATCFSLRGARPEFSRNSAYKLGPYSIPIAMEICSIFERSRLLCTRAIGEPPTETEIELAQDNFYDIEKWMYELRKAIK